MPIYWVSVRLSDPYYFSRIFRQITGLAPREFRQHALAQQQT
ncbi:AraC family transcriptional regulator [Paenibacillus harenae]